MVLTGRDENAGRAAAAMLGEHGAVYTGDAIDPRHATAAIALALEKFGTFNGLFFYAHLCGRQGRHHRIYVVCRGMLCRQQHPTQRHCAGPY